MSPERTAVKWALEGSLWALGQFLAWDCCVVARRLYYFSAIEHRQVTMSTCSQPFLIISGHSSGMQTSGS